MADELEAGASADLKATTSPQAPRPPWWHEVGFVDAGTAILTKFATAKSAREGRAALRLEMQRLNAEKDKGHPRPMSPSKPQTPAAPDKKSGKEAESNGVVKMGGKAKGVQKGPPPLPPPHLRTSGATLSDAELSSVSMIRVQPG